ncbi:MAG TPA: adenylate/guanylate cyclase domain-containing protein [Candidatus Ozemobacteraceae bacterium]|nr:adenylate/guanylate cyclase domain-containing protein [Candidatus Ozemobacteraceae bacterium]
MKSSTDQVLLNIRRSTFMKIAPVLLWLVAVFIPALVGRNLYFATLKEQQEQFAAMGQHQLMTRARELDARLHPEQLLKKQLNLSYYTRAYDMAVLKNNPSTLANSPIGKSLPDFSGDIAEQLASFSRTLEFETGIRPVFVAGLNPDPAKCGLFLRDEPMPAPEQLREIRQEFAEMCLFLNSRANFRENEPAELKTYAPFNFFSQFLEIFDHFNTHFWSLHGSFSARYRERLYIVSMRPPFPPGQGNNIITGILISHLDPTTVITRACRDMSDSEISITWGQAEPTELPKFIEENGDISMITRLSEQFRASFNRPGSTDQLNRAAVKLTVSGKTRQKHLREHATHIDLGLLIFLSFSFLLGAGTSLGQMKLRTSLARLITVAFFVSMFLPLTGLAWLAAANSSNARDSESRQITRQIRQILRQSETAFRLQRYRQQLLMFHISHIIAHLSPEKWGDYVDRFFFNDKYSRFKAHFDNFYLYSATHDRDYFRGQKPEERFRKNELPNVLSGAFRRALMFTDAFAHMSDAGRRKVAQMADFSSGVMEELVDDKFFNGLLGSPGELNNATLLARRDLLTIFFLKGPQQMMGILCLVTNNLLPMQIIDEINARGSFKNKFTLDGYRVEIDFYAISEFYERSLRGRWRGYADVNPPIMTLEAADALYSNSDTSVVNSLQLDDPHLLVTETMLERSIFAVARARPLHNDSRQYNGAGLLAFLALLSCLTLATGISRLILLPVPPFLEAIRAIEENRHDWLLDLNTGDEFDHLAISMNEMNLKLLERRKMLQLVSQTAAEAVKTGNTQEAPRRRCATILFSDIRGFTTISENHSAEEVVAMLNDYFTLMCPIIEANGGHIDKLIGDAIQAVFLSEDEEIRAISAARAALEMRHRLAEFNAARAAAGQFAITNGIGIATGQVTTGVTGSNTGKLEAAIIGEPLQLAATLESYSKFAANTCIIIDPATENLLKNRARVVSLDVPEISQKMSIHELQELIDA